MNKKLLFSAAVLTISMAAVVIMPLAVGAQVAPTVTSISPMSVVAGSPDTTLSVYGTNFVSGSVVKFNGLSIATMYRSPNELSATIPSSYLRTAINDAVYVLNPDGMTSGLPNAILFTITPSSGTPGLPDTGFAPSQSTGLNIMALLGVVALSAALLFLGIQLKKAAK